jgi:hypothetical protein
MQVCSSVNEARVLLADFIIKEKQLYKSGEYGSPSRVFDALLKCSVGDFKEEYYLPISWTKTCGEPLHRSSKEGIQAAFVFNFLM